MATKADLAEYLRREANCTWPEANRFAYWAVEWLAETLAQEGHIELRGLGTFSTEYRPARKSRLPTTTKIPAHRKVKFKPGKQLRKLLKGK